MSNFSLEGVEYDISKLNKKCQYLAVQVQNVHGKIRESDNMLAILTKAKLAYIADIRHEMLTAKAGFDFGTD